MKGKTIGLNTMLYTFDTHEKMVTAIIDMKGRGTIEIVYLNNEYGFEFRPYTSITIGT